MRCLISFGANIGNSLETIQMAAELLQKRLGCAREAFRLSRFFRTPPVGGPTGQPPFVNAVAAAETRLTAIEVWKAIGAVELELGRQRNRRWEARRIDLDILLYEQQRIWTEHLKVPHPRMCMRRFILVPAKDVAADWIDPVSQLSIEQLAASVQAGAGSLLILLDTPAQHQSLFKQLADMSLATIVRPSEAIPRSQQTRWISMAQTQAAFNGTQRLPSAKLTMFLAHSDPRRSESMQPIVAWEKQYHRLAQQLNLLDAADDDGSFPNYDASVDSGGLQQSSRQVWPIAGPRYLLAADDPQWALHEMVSALEAMDCPVEPIVQ